MHVSLPNMNAFGSGGSIGKEWEEDTGLHDSKKYYVDCCCRTRGYKYYEALACIVCLSGFIECYCLDNCLV